MDYIATFNAVLGGVGLLLTGMWLMTDGLKLAAGNTLRQILATWTNSRQRALGTGIMITGLVQSSSAVTVATIGFANASLLSLEEAIWVIFGSNVGTTMTGWIVALVGFKLQIEYLALPLIGVGMFMRLISRSTKWNALGQATVGFGLFFLGIFILKDGFTTQLSEFTLPATADGGILYMLLYILLGTLLTTLMQSSSAAMVITLGAAESGLIPLGSAAAVVIGTNLGTTSTAILSVWGATATAKRVAASHVLFNLITATVAIILLFPMLKLVSYIQLTLGFSETPAMTLAIYHTSFNLLGVIVMWPISKYVVTALNRRFISHVEKASRPQYIDKTALEIPAVAMNALYREMERAQLLSIQAARNLVVHDKDTASTMEYQVVEKLMDEISLFVADLGRKDLPDNIANSLPTVIQLAHQYLLLDELSRNVAELEESVHVPDPELAGMMQNYREMVTRVLDTIKLDMLEEDIERARKNLETGEDEYDGLKFHILKSGSDGSLGMVTVEKLLQQANLMRRIMRTAVKSVERLEGIRLATSSEPVAETKAA